MKQNGVQRVHSIMFWGKLEFSLIFGLGATLGYARGFYYMIIRIMKVIVRVPYGC